MFILGATSILDRRNSKCRSPELGYLKSTAYSENIEKACGFVESSVKEKW